MVVLFSVIGASVESSELIDEFGVAKIVFSDFVSFCPLVAVLHLGVKRNSSSNGLLGFFISLRSRREKRCESGVSSEDRCSDR